MTTLQFDLTNFVIEYNFHLLIIVYVIINLILFAKNNFFNLIKKEIKMKYTQKILIALILMSSLVFFNFYFSNNNILVIDSRKLDANTISTWFRNNGSFNRDPTTGNSGFIWPKGTTMTARYASGLWIGAKVGNDTLIAMAEYEYEYLPGYTDASGIPQGKDDPLYRVYKLTYGVNDIDRQEWPNALLGNSNQGAPVYYDNQSNSWKPLDFGTQTMFYSHTDSYPESHINISGSTAPLKADIKQVNFAVDGLGWIGNTIFTQFTIINRSNQIWNNAYFTLWTDDDLGNATDDKIACDTAIGFGYTYNATNSDQIYGIAPPAVGFLLLKGGSYYTGNNDDTLKYCYNKNLVKKVGFKDKGISSFNWYNNGGDPRVYYETYRFMSGLKRDGNQIINPVGNYLTTYYYSGDPVTNIGWIQSTGDDQRFMMSTGPINVNPGDTQIIICAQIIGRGTSNLNSITVLRQHYIEAKNYYMNCSPNPIGIEKNTEVVKDFKLFQNYPNPFNPVTQIDFSLPKLTFVNLTIYDVLGKKITTLINQNLKEGNHSLSFDATNYPSGVYFYTLQAESYKETKRMVLLK